MANDGSGYVGASGNDAAGRLVDAMRGAVKRLIAKSKELKSQVVHLEKENAHLREDCRKKDVEIESLRQQVEYCKLGLTLRGAASEAGGYTREEAKKKISSMVREIDECMALLKQ